PWCPGWIRRPRLDSAATTDSEALLSDPVTVQPKPVSSSARAFIPEPQMPTRWADRQSPWFARTSGVLLRVVGRVVPAVVMGTQEARFAVDGVKTTSAACAGFQ